MWISKAIEHCLNMVYEQRIVGKSLAQILIIVNAFLYLKKKKSQAYYFHK